MELVRTKSQKLTRFLSNTVKFKNQNLSFLCDFNPYTDTVKFKKSKLVVSLSLKARFTVYKLRKAKTYQNMNSVESPFEL